eukprot:CAMPEP_0184493344 /NCGR_PEP_ID=MMETSP0113_2-20130426/25754_1 /TAXON_ID=91329 /ORGANISM="Norrisiella sphaerica, Strain BC52" /LENGTH=147 /DNA_ID=CAMNT_0026878567 /DNA_START=48 /DNA_END=491 /DNA_ORIENTATION=-
MGNKGSKKPVPEGQTPDGPVSVPREIRNKLLYSLSVTSNNIKTKLPKELSDMGVDDECWNFFLESLSKVLESKELDVDGKVSVDKAAELLNSVEGMLPWANLNQIPGRFGGYGEREQWVGFLGCQNIMGEALVKDASLQICFYKLPN